ncbi:MAG: universal stress protein [bacterium]
MRAHAATVLMATDGTERSDGALRVAEARAKATGAELELMTVIQSEPVVAAEHMYFGEAEGLRRWTVRRREVEEQVERVLGRDTILSITVFAGNPAFTISRVAIERRAALVVVGLGRHDIAHRIFTDETALQVARIARVPVLAVPASALAAPRHAVVAVDFSDIATRAAQAAIDSVADDGLVDLVHVMPANDTGSAGADGYERWATQRLVTLAGQLIVPPGVTVSQALLRGGAASELLDFANSVGADVISTGTHGRGFVARAILGSVTTKLMRGATCSMLAVPRDPLPALAPSPADAVAGESFESPMAWSRLLADFGRRNAGRRTILEVDDVEIGAQAQEYNYPLVGTSYSERDGRVDLVLGDRAPGGRNVSRSMGSVIAVDVLTDGEGHDTALRVQHGTSQTLLTFAA